MQRKAKIVATIGPASDSEEILDALIRAGVNVARLNFSHGTHEEHAARITNIRKTAKKLGRSVGILQDLQGPKIRVGKLTESLRLEEGNHIRFYAEEDQPPDEKGKMIPVDFRELFDSVETGDSMLLDDGRLSLRVESVEGGCLFAEVIVGGELSSHKGINLPGVRLRVSGYTPKDETDLAFGITQGVDAVAVSFVRTPQDVIQVREAMERFVEGVPAPMLIAKLERSEAMDNLDEILDVVDGVMVARGDLGVEMPPERVPVLQKMIIRKASARAKIIITATQMLESMIHNPLPTRAEASDIANAIFDGTDAVMLSAETAAGEYPVESVKIMERIIREAESHSDEWGTEIERVRGLGESDAASMSRAAHELANDKDVKAVAVFTSQGSTAWLISKIRPPKRILAFTPHERTYRKMAFLWGVYPQLVPFANSMEEMLAHVDAALLENKVEQGNQVVLLCGFPVGSMKPPNMALLHTVGEA
ncbi:MAG: pyruvate kinase [Anaerolineae bacterium]|nr:pyruvate kinase [Anaerolineae bacterium]MBT4311892.1 pyruvate kinase [Anaerolineae bacterium]MBT4458687.1 pyruvate kinase [Anaerolineae bacterium]MBT4841408.1 pyruvate kinase [Anaerolineae bacterium]MBT6060494.1 pyruvate kinase [Anaerolineae bacterium]